MDELKPTLLKIKLHKTKYQVNITDDRDQTTLLNVNNVKPFFPVFLTKQTTENYNSLKMHIEVA